MFVDRASIVAIFMVATLVATPAGAAAGVDRVEDTTTRLDVLARQADANTVWRDALHTAIEPDPDCDDATPFVQWIRSQVASLAPATLDVIATYGVFDWPYLWTLGGDQDATDEHLGVDGEYTQELQRRHRENRRFWAVSTDDVVLQGMHGEVVADDTKMVPLVEFVVGADHATAQAIVDVVQATIDADPAIDYDHPILTLNAFAFSGEIPGLGPIPDKIVIGDGVLAGLEAIGLGDVAPGFVHAHEFAHHVQHEVGVLGGDIPSPEATRRVELMADALGAYEVAHVRGATFRTKRLVGAIAIAFNNGDCGFESDNHHGTPEQRAHAVEWGVRVATADTPRATVMPPADLVDRFDAALPDLLGD